MFRKRCEAMANILFNSKLISRIVAKQFFSSRKKIKPRDVQDFALTASDYILSMKQALLNLRRIRLVVRTRGSQPLNRGSIPLCATKIQAKCELIIKVKSVHFHSHQTTINGQTRLNYSQSSSRNAGIRKSGFGAYS